MGRTEEEVGAGAVRGTGLGVSVRSRLLLAGSVHLSAIGVLAQSTGDVERLAGPADGRHGQVVLPRAVGLLDPADSRGQHREATEGPRADDVAPPHHLLSDHWQLRLPPRPCGKRHLLLDGCGGCHPARMCPHILAPA